MTKGSKPVNKTIKASSVLALGLAAFGIAGGVALAQGYGKGVEHRMERLDTDGDGAISVSELDARQREFVARADANGDGVITREELETLHEERRAERRARRFPDKNEDGVVDKAEFQAAAAARFEKLDKNGDGALTEDEIRDGRKGRHHRRGQ